MAPNPIDPAVFSPDTCEFIALLHKHAVRWVLVGGEAVIYYGHPRLTGDVDFFYDRSTANAKSLFAALEEFWAGNIPTVSGWEELVQLGLVVQFGVPPNRIDLVNQIDGVDFEEAWAGRLTLTLPLTDRSVPLYLIGLAELIRNKQAAGRPKDLEDLTFLRRAQDKGR